MIGDVGQKRRSLEKYPIFRCHGNAEREKVEHYTLSKKSRKLSQALSNILLKFNEKHGVTAQRNDQPSVSGEDDSSGQESQICAVCLTDFASRMPLPLCLVNLGNMQNASVSLETMMKIVFIQTVIQKEALSCGLCCMPLLHNCMSSSYRLHIYNIVTHMPIARRRLCKHIPEVTLSTMGHPLLDNGPINTHSW
jgi:hypothetical protein